MSEQGRALVKAMHALGFTQDHARSVEKAANQFAEDMDDPERSLAALMRASAPRRKRRAALAKHIRKVADLMDADGAGITFDLELSHEAGEALEAIEKTADIRTLADALDQKNASEMRTPRTELLSFIEHRFWGKLAAVYEDARPGEAASLYNDERRGIPRGQFFELIRLVYAEIGMDCPSPHTVQEWCQDRWPENRGVEQKLFALRPPFA